MDTLLNNFIILFIVIDPIGVAWLFTALCSHSDKAHRRHMALRGVLLAAGILLVFYFIGDVLLHALGISLPAFRIAGGLLLFLLSIDMVFARQTGLRSTTREEQVEAEHKQDISVFPLAFPLIAGPGALTSILLMSANKQEPILFYGTLVVLTVVLTMTLISLLLAERLVRLLGETGANVISRMLGLILAALAVQFVIDGIKGAIV